MPVRMVFEDGDEGFGDVSAWIGAGPGTIPVSRQYKKDTPLEGGNVRRGFVPLQASDWLAYELGLAIRQMDAGKIKNIKSFRWPFHEFQRILGDAGTFRTKDIADAEQKLAALRSDPDWENTPGIELLSKRFNPNATT